MLSPQTRPDPHPPASCPSALRAWASLGPRGPGRGGGGRLCAHRDSRAPLPLLDLPEGSHARPGSTPRQPRPGGRKDAACPGGLGAWGRTGAAGEAPPEKGGAGVAGGAGVETGGQGAPIPRGPCECGVGHWEAPAGRRWPPGEVLEPLPASRLPPPPEHSPPRPAGLATAWSCRHRPPSTGMTSAAKPATATSASLVRAFLWLPARAGAPGASG